MTKIRLIIFCGRTLFAPVCFHVRLSVHFVQNCCDLFTSLRDDLIAKGYSFTSDSDCEVLLPMYKEYGTEMFSMLDAEFACIIYDHEQKSRREIYPAARYLFRRKVKIEHSTAGTSVLLSL